MVPYSECSSYNGTVQVGNLFFVNVNLVWNVQILLVEMSLIETMKMHDIAIRIIIIP